MAVRPRVVLGVVAALVVLSGVGAGLAVLTGGRTGAAQPAASRESPTPTPSPTLTEGAADPDPRVAALAVATAYLDAWQLGDWATMQAQLDGDGGDMARVYGGMADRLRIAEVSARPLEPSADGSLVPFQVTLTLDGLGDVSWSTTLRITRTEAAVSKVHFTAAAVYPELAVGQRLDLVPSAQGRPDVLDREGRSLAKNSDLVSNLVGSFAPATGKATGLQRVLGEELGEAGDRALAVVEATSGEVIEVVKDFPPPAGPPEGVRTTIDLDVQRAAAKALSGAPARAALVAIDVPTGEVLALANRPYTGIPPATSGSYPPGSTFKIVTALAALREGRTPKSTVSCPTTITVYGKVFVNYEKAPDRDMTLTEAFADSCNTAFIGLARDLPEGALQAAAEDLGFNAPPPLPVASVGGSYPEPKDGAELAASAIGQGRVQASPLQMAGVAAAVASGTWRQPHVLDCPDCASTVIPEAAKIRPMMRAVVTSGTGTAAAGVPGGPVHAKTGTAEFGTGTIRNHAWFVGWQGDVAFAVFVDKGVSGGHTAAPIAARFLTSLAASG